MTLSDFISLASLASLVYFAYGTFRIDRKLGQTNEHLAEQNEISQRIENVLRSRLDDPSDR